MTLSTSLALAGCGQSADEPASKIVIFNAWMRLPPGGRDISAAYLVIHNNGGADTLLSASSPMADDVQMHIHEVDGEVMRMRHEDSVAIPANSSVDYKPGGRHLMMFGVPDDLRAGDEILLTLVFERGGEISTYFRVKTGL